MLVQSEDDAGVGETHFCRSHLTGMIKEEQELWAYDAQLIDF